MEETFSIQKSFWGNLNPLSWHNSTILGALLGFYALFLPAFIFIGLQPATATSVEASSESTLDIPSLALSSSVVDVQLSGKTLPTPAYDIGRYSLYPSKIFLFGHSTTAFRDLEDITLGAEILYDSETFVVETIETLAVRDIDMSALLAPAPERTLVLMTCAGTESFGRYPERLIITATQKTQKTQTTSETQTPELTKTTADTTI